LKLAFSPNIPSAIASQNPPFSRVEIETGTVFTTPIKAFGQNPPFSRVEIETSTIIVL